MNIALPVLLLTLGGLTLWVLTESTVKWYVKTACITIVCLFTVVFWTTIHTFLGWPANEEDVPEKMVIHWVIVKEPNKFTGYEGAIYFLSESKKEEENNVLLRFFGYGKDRTEPRLYEVKYNRKLHEQIEKQMKPKLRKGQVVMGKLVKGEGENEKKGIGEGEAASKNKGGGSESQEQDWEFHELRPSDFQKKPER